MRSEQLLQVESGRLLQKLCFTGMSRVIAEGNETGSRKVDHLTVKLEDPGGSLDLGLQSVRRGAEPEVNT